MFIYIILYTRLFTKWNLFDILFYSTFIAMKISRPAIYCKFFKVEKFCCCRTKFNSLQNIHGCIHVTRSYFTVLSLFLFHSVITISLKKLCNYQSIHKNHKTFPPWTICNMWYTCMQVYVPLQLSKFWLSLHFPLLWQLLLPITISSLPLSHVKLQVSSYDGTPSSPSKQLIIPLLGLVSFRQETKWQI